MEAVAEDDAELRPAVGAGFAQQIRNGAIYNFSVDRFNNNIKTTQYANAPPGFLYPGDDGFENGNAGMKNNLWQFSPRVGFAWDPTGDGRMSIRTGYSLGYDFVNAQFHLNTSVAPPFNAEARVTNPVGGFDDPWRGHRQRELLPVHDRAELTVPVDRAVHLDPAGHQAATAAVVEPERAAADRQRPGGVGDLHRHYSDRLWNVRSLNPGVYIPGSCTLQTATGPQFFPVCSVNTNLDQRRELTMADYADGKYLGPTDEHTAFGTQKYNGLLLSVQRRLINGFSVAANYTLSKCNGHPTQGGTTPNVNSGYVDPNNIDYDYGACDSDRRHLFNLTASAETPRFDNDFVRALASDWRLSGIFRAYSGSPQSVTVTGDPARTGIGGQRANQILDDPYGDGTLDNYLQSRGVRLAGGRHARHHGAELRLRPGPALPRPVARKVVPLQWQPPHRGAHRVVQRAQLVPVE